MFDEEIHGLWESSATSMTTKRNLICDGMFDEEIHGLWESNATSMTTKRNLICDGEEKRDDNARTEKLCIRNSREEKNIIFEDVSKYFYMPITQAVRELNVGFTLLKKKCKELGIPRWPQRKMKSLQTLIKNVQDLEREEGEAGEVQLRCTIEILEQERKLMEKKSAMELEEKTKRLRQVCFKANYNKRRMMAAEEHYPSATAGYFCDRLLEY